MSTMSCVVCGKADLSQSDSGGVIGRPESFKDMVGKCQKCGQYICGGCAKPNFKIYAKPGYEDEAQTFVEIEHSRGRETGEIMDEVNRRFGGAELMVTYHCTSCDGQLGPA